MFTSASSSGQIWKQPKCPLKGGGQPHCGASSPQIGFGGPSGTLTHAQLRALRILLTGKATPSRSHTDWMIPFLWPNDKIIETESGLGVVRG